MTFSHPPAYFSQCSAAQASELSRSIDEAIHMVRKAVESFDGHAPPIYNKWFGWAWNQAYVKEVYSRILVNLTTIPIAFDCNCFTPHYAYVDRTKPFQIHICPVFWFPREDKWNTHGGVIIHEMSHFEVVGGTRDHASGVWNSLQLALSGGSGTTNADTYEYYAEDLQ